MDSKQTQEVEVPERATGVVETARTCEHCGQVYRIVSSEADEYVPCPRCKKNSLGTRKS